MRLVDRLPIEWRVERVDLGTHRGRKLVARVRHAGLRLGSGQRRLRLARARVTGIEVTEQNRRTEVALRAPLDPWLLLAGGGLAASLASAMAIRATRRGGRA